jgi:hypothetical protein
VDGRVGETSEVLAHEGAEHGGNMQPRPLRRPESGSFRPRYERARGRTPRRSTHPCWRVRDAPELRCAASARVEECNERQPSTRESVATAP